MLIDDSWLSFDQHVNSGEKRSNEGMLSCTRLLEGASEHAGDDETAALRI